MPAGFDIGFDVGTELRFALEPDRKLVPFSIIFEIGDGIPNLLCGAFDHRAVLN